jgi:hypothetical protein
MLTLEFEHDTHTPSMQHEFGLQCSSMVECLLGMCETLGPILIAAERNSRHDFISYIMYLYKMIHYFPGTLEMTLEMTDEDVLFNILYFPFINKTIYSS